MHLQALALAAIRFLLLFVLSVSCLSQENAREEDGRTVAYTSAGQRILLFRDGTWEGEDGTPFVHKSPYKKTREVSIQGLLLCRVSRIIDGDTIVVAFDDPPFLTAAEERVRLLGVNAPELGNSKESMELGAFEARAFLKERLTEGTVYLALDYLLRDGFGRLLAYLFLPDGACVNGELLAAGRARLYDNPNIHFFDEFRSAEETAKEARAGLWSEEPDKLFIETVWNEGSSEYVVVANASEGPIDLEGWQLHDSQKNIINLPALILEPGDSVVLYSGKDGVHDPPRAYYPRTNNIWGNDGDTAFLQNGEGVLVDRYAYNRKD
jgi:micrococcal nuclease